MKKVFTALFLIGILAFTWISKVAITADFIIRQDYIAKTLCENRDKPDMHCNGKCVLMQKLNLVDDKSEEPLTLPEALRIEISSFLISDSLFEVQLQSTPDLSHPAPRSVNLFPSIFPQDIFHPPRPQV